MTETPDNIRAKTQAGELLRDAAASLYSVMSLGGRPWMELSFQEKTRWGLWVAPVVMTTIQSLDPDNKDALIQEVHDTASAWLRSMGGQTP